MHRLQRIKFLRIFSYAQINNTRKKNLSELFIYAFFTHRWDKRAFALAYFISFLFIHLLSLSVCMYSLHLKQKLLIFLIIMRQMVLNIHTVKKKRGFNCNIFIIYTTLSSQVFLTLKKYISMYIHICLLLAKQFIRLHLLKWH